MKKSILFLVGLISVCSYGQDAMDRMAYIKGDVLVMMDNSENLDEVVKDYQIVGGVETQLEIAEVLSAPTNIWRLTFNHEAVSHIQLLQAFSQNEHILIAQNNHYIQNRETPNDPQFGTQWHHIDGSDNDIDSDDAWDITTGGATPNGDRIVVAVLEGGGSDWDHPDLEDNHWVNSLETPGNGIDDDGNGYVDDYDGWNTSSNNDNIAAGDHGTGVSGMIGAVGDNGTGVTGINWDVEIMQIDMAGISESNVIEAYTYPLVMRKEYNATNGEKGAFVVATNASWGIDYGDPASAPLWCAFYDTLGHHGILNLGATTNSPLNVDVVGDLPTACGSDYMISITATNSSDVRTFSGYGATTIDLGAPGANVYTTENGGYGYTSGTSFATPLTAGVVALMYSAPCTFLADLSLINPQQAADKVRTALFNGVDAVGSLSGECVTGGRLNAKGAIDELLADCDSGSGIVEEAEDKYILYPNPANTEVQFVTVGNTSLTFKLYDNLGRVLLTEQINDTQSIDIANLAAGVYVYTVETANGETESGKLIVE
ncbi:MAG: S8 family peptidase [Flavobacteriales bacterium]|nr:S8 family peptidase [Flavobacteriales bacterium]